MFVGSLALQEVKEVGTVATQKEINTDLYMFGINNFQSSDGCSSTLQKVKTVQRMHVH